MRLLVFLLVFANLFFYAFGAGYFGHSEGPDAQRITQQLAPEKVKIIPENEAPPAPPVTAPEPLPVAAPEAAPANVPEAQAEKVVIACNRWATLPPKDAERLAALISKRFPDFKLNRRQDAAEGNGWWVFIPPLADKAEADKKAGQLRAFGVTDYFIVQEPAASRFAISLGVFSSEKGAQERLAELNEKGVRSAKLSPRPGNDGTVTLSARGPEGDREALRAAATGLLPKVRAQDCL